MGNAIRNAKVPVPNTIILVDEKRPAGFIVVTY